MPLTKKKKNLLKRWVGAILIALAVGTGIYLIATRTNQSAVDLYETYYQPSLTLLHSDSLVNLANVKNAKQAFDQQNYEEAAKVLYQSLNVEPANQSIQLALGISQLQLNEIEKAKQSFSVIDETPFRERAQWYLAMIFLKQSDVRNAQTILENFTTDQASYEAAQRILKKL